MPGLDALAQGDEAWGKVDFTEPNPIAALMAMIAKRDRESAADAGDLEENEQQAQAKGSDNKTSRDQKSKKRANEQQ